MPSQATADCAVTAGAGNVVMQANETVLRLEGVHKNFGGLVVLTNIDLAIGTAVNLVLAILDMLIGNQLLHFVFLFFGLSVLYFIDYACNGLTVSLIYDQMTTNNATFGPAIKRTLKASPGIVIFAVISGFFDLLSSYASSRDDLIGRILVGIIRSLWTTAVYVVMPSMVIEGLGFFASFKRSKELMKEDPTQIGVGYISIGLITSILQVVFIGGGSVLAYQLQSMIGGGFGMLLGLFVALLLNNVYWSLSGFLRTTYYTCYYMWASQCLAQRRADPQLAPLPLQRVLMKG